MGVLPLQFVDGQTRETLGLTGDDQFTITGVADLTPRQTVNVNVTRADGSTFSFDTLCRIDPRSEEHTSELQSLMRISYAVFCLKKIKYNNTYTSQASKLH